MQLIRIGLEHPDIRYEIFYGASDKRAAGGTTPRPSASAIGRKAAPRITAPPRWPPTPSCPPIRSASGIRAARYCSDEFDGGIERAPV